MQSLAWPCQPSWLLHSPDTAWSGRPRMTTPLDKLALMASGGRELSLNPCVPGDRALYRRRSAASSLTLHHAVLRST